MEEPNQAFGAAPFWGSSFSHQFQHKNKYKAQHLKKKTLLPKDFYFQRLGIKFNYKIEAPIIQSKK